MSKYRKYFGQDESILLLELLVEWSFLYKYNSTFTEKFLSLQRFDITNQPDGLNKKQIFLSLISLAFGPYLFKKLDDYNELLADKAFGLQSEDLSQLSQNEKNFYICYGKFKKFYEFVRIITWISYASSVSKHPNPVMAILLRDMRLGYTDVDVLQNMSGNKLSDRIASNVSSTFNLAFKSFAFVIQFIDYWLSQADVRQLLSTRGSNVNIPSPRNLEQEINKTKSSSSSTSSSDASVSNPSLRRSLSPGLCPLCLRSRRNSTALSCSGYIFCYSCITHFVTEHSSCPISGFPATVTQLIRIYD